VKSQRKRGEQQFSDERILGSGEFVRDLLGEAEASSKGHLPVVSAEREAGERLVRACEAFGMKPEMLQRGCRMKACSELRRKLAVEFVSELGMTYARSGELLGISAAGVSQIFRRESEKLKLL
jgi:hypothetical protein